LVNGCGADIALGTTPCRTFSLYSICWTKRPTNLCHTISSSN